MRLLVGGLLVAAVAAACGGTETGPSDPDAAPLADAPNPTALRVNWKSMPPIPVSTMSEITVTTATFHLARLEIIGDGGSAGATTRKDFDLTWNDNTTSPQEVVFDAAPLGLYSTIALGVRAEVARNAFEITGSVKINGVFEPFRIYDTEPLDVEIDGYDVEVEPGTVSTMNVKLDIKDTLRAVQYEALPLVAGVRTLAPADAQMDAVRDGLATAFANEQ